MFAVMPEVDIAVFCLELIIIMSKCIGKCNFRTRNPREVLDAVLLYRVTMMTMTPT